jgi:hypothetical protein
VQVLEAHGGQVFPENLLGHVRQRETGERAYTRLERLDVGPPRWSTKSNTVRRTPS